MPKTLIKTRLQTNRQKIKLEHELSKTKSYLPPRLQTFKQKLLSGSGFLVYT